MFAAYPKTHFGTFRGMWPAYSAMRKNHPRTGYICAFFGRFAAFQSFGIPTASTKHAQRYHANESMKSDRVRSPRGLEMCRWYSHAAEILERSTYGCCTFGGPWIWLNSSL